MDLIKEKAMTENISVVIVEHDLERDLGDERPRPLHGGREA